MGNYDGNVVFKCTYNDGGADGYVGFGGTCSMENIRRNVHEQPRPWCSHPRNLCTQFFKAGFLGNSPEYPCYESRLTHDWKFSPGHTHPRDGGLGRPVRINHAKVGKIALFTTLHPKLVSEYKRARRNPESSRLVFAISRIVNIYEEDDTQWVQCDPNTAIRLSESATRALLYWRFKSPTSAGHKWGSGLVRYISNAEVLTYLSALYPRVRSAEERAKLERLSNSCGPLNFIASDTNQYDQIFDELESKQKYGPGGEGDRHRNLKTAIFKRPDLLQLGGGNATMEHRFLTGDRVDVLVSLNNGEHCVVEVEVEGLSTMTGAHQALKYQALCQGKYYPDDQISPHAFLVAYSIPENVRKFCRHHGIKTLEVKQEEVNEILSTD